MKRVLIVAGETSGDLHGSSLMNRMKAVMPDIEFKGIGGTRMIEEGLEAFRHVRDMNFMGFTEVIRHLPYLHRTMRELKSLVDAWRPDLAILIDYPGFNLKFARYIKRKNIPVMYYISPQLWAWHKSRVKLVRKYVDRMVVLFDFERDFYNMYGIIVDFVGHPLLDVVHTSQDRERFRTSLEANETVSFIGLIPGSRKQEIDRILPSMVESIEIIKKNQSQMVTALGCASEIEDNYYERFTSGSDIILLRGMTYDIMAHADALVVTSGTATLESGILGTPMVIVYRTSPLTYHIGKMLISVPSIGMINIVAGSRIVPELWQNEVTPDNIADEVKKILQDRQLRETTKYVLGIAREKLGERGASEKASRIAIEMMNT